MVTSTVAAVRAVTLCGLDGHLVDVEAHVGRGLVSFTLVGMPDTSVREAKERVRAALQVCQLEVLDRRITVNLSPAGLPKSGGGFDLAIAAAVLLATGSVRADPFDGTVLVGELGLDGAVRSVPGILPTLVAAVRHGARRAVVPVQARTEAALVPGLDLVPVEHLADLVHWAGGRAHRPPVLVRPRECAHGMDGFTPPGAEPDLRDVHGQEEAVEALVVAAAGGHHLHLVGEPGSGKTMLAERLVGILPDLDDETALTVTALHSLAGLLGEDAQLIRRPPWCAPHHSATMPGMIGGGSGRLRPGAVSLAHGGVLFLDEAPEFAPSILDALRQPLEDGEVTLQRLAVSARFPCAFQLVLASNPCPCGNAGGRARRCRCTSLERRRYAARLSGPLRDRIDITVPVRTPTRADLRRGPTCTSDEARARVAAARAFSARRLADTPWRRNADLPGSWLRSSGMIPSTLRAPLETAVEQGRLTMRGADRVLRIALTLADLEEREHPEMADLGRALALREVDDE